MRYAKNFCQRTTEVVAGNQSELMALCVYTGKCIACHKEQVVKIPASAEAAYAEGLLIQDAMPNVSADDREFLISGICAECFNQVAKAEGW